MAGTLSALFTNDCLVLELLVKSGVDALKICGIILTVLMKMAKLLF